MWHVWETGEMRTGFLLGGPKERDHLEDPDLDGSFILRYIFSRNWIGVVDWVDLAQKRNSCHAVVNAGMNLQIP
jgi:hypothetical protein